MFFSRDQMMKKQQHQRGIPAEASVAITNFSYGKKPSSPVALSTNVTVLGFPSYYGKGYSTDPFISFFLYLVIVPPNFIRIGHNNL
jgi:hypothetical protein